MRRVQHPQLSVQPSRSTPERIIMTTTRQKPAKVAHRRVALVLGGAALAVTAVASPAYANLTGVSTSSDPAAVDGFGFPNWYSDGTFKVTLCVASTRCLGGPTVGTPDEAFYAVARAEVALKSNQAGASGGRARYRAVVEAAWASEDMLDGEQITFTRTQVTADKIDLGTYSPGTEITFATPYGDLKGKVVGDIRNGRFTGKLDRARKESTLGTPLDGFKAPLSSAIYGPKFLHWDTDRPAGFLGDPATLHTIKGATGTNPNAFFARGGRSNVATEFEVAGECVDINC
jgi:hypothetical protein